MSYPQTPPPSVKDILRAYGTRQDEDKEILLAVLKAKTAEDERLALATRQNIQRAHMHKQTMDAAYHAHTSISGHGVPSASTADRAGVMNPAGLQHYHQLHGQSQQQQYQQRSRAQQQQSTLDPAQLSRAVVVPSSAAAQHSHPNASPGFVPFAPSLGGREPLPPVSRQSSTRFTNGIPSPALSSGSLSPALSPRDQRRSGSSSKTPDSRNASRISIKREED